MHLRNRELERQDIPIICNYWETLSTADIARMYIDVTKLPSRKTLEDRLTAALEIPPGERLYDPLIWEVEGKAIGMTNLNKITKGHSGYIHLHIFEASNRGKGFGRRLFLMSVEKYLERHQLQMVLCEPAQTNPDPNAMMNAFGLSPKKGTFCPIVSAICFPHEMNRYEFTSTIVENLKKSLH